MNRLSLSGRTSGVLLHPTSLPGPRGIGSLGPAAFRFVDFLVQAGQGVWQILPLSPTGFGNSPYSSYGALAGNPLMISVSELVQQGDLTAADRAGYASESLERVDYGRVMEWKVPRLEKAARHLLSGAHPARRARFEEFCQVHAEWLDDYALFMTVKTHFDRRAASESHWGATWNTYWDRDIAVREPAAVERWRSEHGEQLDLHRVWQFYFFEQWKAVRQYARERGVVLVGDMPIFVALDSADVWAAPRMFTLDADLQEQLVAGVPPDYFSETGQRWGNPLYNWDAMVASGFHWWVRRFRALLELVDVVRIDHFRGFAACWAIPAHHRTAVDGEWIPVPGDALFRRLHEVFGELPFLAEDLGVITPDVEALRDRFQFPGMKVLQVGLEDIGPENPHLPENHEEHCVVYPGTHDNNTAVGWYSALSRAKREAIVEYHGGSLNDPAWDLIRMAMQSPARAAIIPMQDILRLGSEARMNTPATTSGNWQWRMTGFQHLDVLADDLAKLSSSHSRHPLPSLPGAL
jgi:4-alpha-glucanotransferase